MIDKNKIINRFKKYVGFDTHSIPDSEIVPSNPIEIEFATYLKNELIEIGIRNIEIDKNGFLYAYLEASKGCEDKPPIAFITHLDVTSEVKSSNINMIVEDRNGETIIKTDNTTLLGADDKAGILEVVSTIEMFINNPNLIHPKIIFVATVDEETGEGIKYIDLTKINAKYAYTVDGEEVGEISSENFFASTIKATINGYCTHPGDAYGKMKNAILIANEFIQQIPYELRPENSKDRDGFIMIENIAGTVNMAKIDIIFRSFSELEMKKFENIFVTIKNKINNDYGNNTCEFVIENEYDNMAKYITKDNEHLINVVKDIYNEKKIRIIDMPVRGGTDGANLAAMGLVAPNIGTGAMNIHSVNEYITVESIMTVIDILIKLCEKIANLDI